MQPYARSELTRRPSIVDEMAAETAWFCLQSQPRHEHIAAAHLRQTGAAEVFLPRIRFPRATRRGKVWFTEALFPGYLFAKFDWRASLRQVRHARGVRGVVHFGERWPTIPEAIIAELRRAFGESELRTLGAQFAPGDEVQIAEGPLRGFKAVISGVLPGTARVAVLLDFLGQQTVIEFPAHSVVKAGDARMAT
jgi:transcriptional antiterminator RfaH